MKNISAKDCGNIPVAFLKTAIHKIFSTQFSKEDID
jgi:hypothetical protein